MEELREESKKTKNSKRELIKTIAIIFLSVMLLLTFFSNTIMNYSLPQVATEYVQSDTIVSKIRGTGTVEASDPYEVNATESRIVTAVKVSVGDEVKAGDPLLELEDVESDELVAARKELDDLRLSYSTSVIEDGISVAILDKIEEGSLENLETMQNSIIQHKNVVNSYQASIDTYQIQVATLNAQVDALGYIDTSAESAAVRNAKTSVVTADINFGNADASLKNAEADMNDKQNKYQSAVSAKATYEDAVSARKSAEAALKKAKKDDNASSESEEAIANAKTALDKARAAEDAAKLEYDRWGEPSSALNEYNSSIGAYDEASNAYSVAVASQSSANNTLSLAQDALARKEDVTEEIKALNRQLADINGKLAIAQLNLATSTTAYTEAQTLYKNELALENQYKSIVLAEEKVNKLEKEAVGATLNAPVNGTITQVAIASGEKMVPDQAVIVISPAGREKTVTLSVTNEQAARVKVGAIGEVNNSWYYGDLSAKLVKIKDDSNNPGKGKLLVFAITGDVENGASLDISAGDKSSSYDLVVPLSAIREDKNGKYILSITSKSSPLGNRYKATRVDVEVMSQDETKAAIKGDVESYSYVITTSSKPVEAGDQVRFYD